ncbi:MAG: RNA 2',3'-cyclic phosphodiesterase [Bacillota bacterium]
MRSFLAINIPDHCKDLIEKKVNLIKREVSQDIKWVEKDNWHLTLKFLGDINKNKVTIIKDRLSLVKNDFTKFGIKFQGIGAFPDLNYPKVFFLKINQGKHKLIKLNQEIENQLKREGFKPEERDYIPHLTVARSREQTNLRQLSQIYKKFTDKFFINIYMRAEKISLMKSELYSGGPVYKKIFDVFLKKP